MNFKAPKVVTNTLTKLSPHGPAIALGCGIGGMGTAIGLAWRNSPIAKDRVDKRKKKEKKEKLSPKEYISETWDLYLPVAGLFASSTAVLIASHKENTKRIATYATAAQLSETALREYREKAKEIVGPKKEKVIREKVIEEDVAKNPPTKSSIPVMRGNNSDLQLCRDYISGRYIWTSTNFIKKAENEINQMIMHENYATLSDFYDILEDLSNQEIERGNIGDTVRWSSDTIGPNNLIEFDVGAVMHNGEAILYLDLPADQMPISYR